MPIIYKCDRLSVFVGLLAYYQTSTKCQLTWHNYLTWRGVVLITCIGYDVRYSGNIAADVMKLFIIDRQWLRSCH